MYQVELIKEGYFKTKLYIFELNHYLWQDFLRLILIFLDSLLEQQNPIRIML